MSRTGPNDSTRSAPLPTAGNAASRGRLCLTVAGVLALGVAFGWYFRRPAVVGPPAAVAPAVREVPSGPALAPLSVSPFLNTRSDVRFVGSAACRECHSEAHDSYAQSAMSRSMAPVDPNREPPDAEFDHATSGRRFTVHRRDGQLWQRDVLTQVAGQGDIELADHPLKYVIGSGHFSRTYLAEIDGFLVEAPLTWFTSTGRCRSISSSFANGFPRNPCL